MMRRVSVYPWIALTVLFLAIAYSYPESVADDAHISYRYAANFAAGEGLVFNPGERVEGYTNFLWTFILGIAIWVGANPIAVSQTLGVLAAVALIALTYRLAGERGAWGAILAAAFVATSPELALEAVQGLETTRFALLVGLTLTLRLREQIEPNATPWSGLAGGLAALCRPEGYLVFALLEAIGLLAGGRARLRQRLPAWGLFLVLAVPHLAFRLAYYGDLFPNTFYAKVGSGGSQLARGLDYVRTFAVHHPALVGLAVLGSFAHWREGRRTATRTAMLVALPITYLVYVVAVGGDFKPSARFILPVLLPMAVLAASGAALVARYWRGAWVFAFAFALLDFGLSYPPVEKLAAWRAMRLTQQRIAAETLAAHYPKETSMAIYNVGTIPWITGFKTIDMWGLTDAHIARRPVNDMGSGIAGHEKSDLFYVFQRRPDIHVPTLQFVTTRPVALEVPAYYPANFKRFYVARSLPAGDKWVNFFERQDLAPPPRPHP